MATPAQAVIVAGGFGTRLRPLTVRRPKHLLEVGGVPFLFHQIARLADAGVRHVVLATSYHANLFEPVLGDGGRWGVRLDYVQEREPLGTAGAIRNVLPALSVGPDGAVVVLNGDILSAHDLTGQLADFRVPRSGRRVDASLHLVEVPDARPFGCVPTDDTGRVTGFMEKSDQPVTNQVNAGCYVFRREVLDTIPDGRAVSVEHETFPGLVADGRLVVGFVDTSYWRDVGTPQALVAASRDVVLGSAPSSAIDAVPGGARIAASAVVASSATVDGGSTVAEHVRIGVGAVVSGSVVMPGACLDPRAVVVESVIGPGAVVGSGVELHRVTLGDQSRIRSGARVPAGTRIDCGADLGG